MIRLQKLITKRSIKKTNLMLDVLIFLIFENQNSIKFIQRRNYKNTSFLHTNFLQNYNWTFWRKHSQFSLLPTDIIAYHNIINTVFTTQEFITNRVVTLHNLFSMTFNQNVVLINSLESGTQSTGKLWPAFEFYEREVAELFGITFANKKDSRNLLLDYNNYSTPLKKNNSIYGKSELRYTKFFDGPKILEPTLSSI